MYKAAKKEGILLEIVSGYRSYERQKSIWNRKYKANEAAGLSPSENIKKIIEYSTLPGTSRHHWGTDVDLIDGSKTKEGDVLVAEKFHGNGPYVRMKSWMDQNANRFGFFLPYTNDSLRPGFYYEPWHYSYAPLSIPLLQSYLKMDLNKVLITDGLEGRASLTPVFVKEYFEKNIWSELKKNDPNQILLAIEQNGQLIGYGGLVHISWVYKRAELSFLLK